MFLDVAASIDDINFGISSNDEGKEVRISRKIHTCFLSQTLHAKDHAVVLFKKFDEGRAEYDG